ncbi:hypothetical protein [uncultured Proteiniphilum sp.]|uniref:hypothetical protein n=1 Tax=uncultured Proteiniphilum sp. TaxID=497637 RepID=UPI00262C51FF|nr:hypothetical protein [uncultured Proteiniphilum sp.]
MIGLLIKYNGKVYKVGNSDKGVFISSFIVMHRNEFILEGGVVASFQTIRDGIEFEVEISDINETDISLPISEENNCVEIDPEYLRMLSDRKSEWEWNEKRRTFYEIRSILIKEGILSSDE